MPESIVSDSNVQRSTVDLTMPSRLNKRQLREQEELSALRPADDGPDIDDDATPSSVDKSAMVGFLVIVRPGGSTEHRKFGTLVVEDLEEEEPTDKSSKPKKVCGPVIARRESHADGVGKGKKKKKQFATDPISQNSPRSNAPKKSRKQKVRAVQSNDSQDFDKVLAELSLESRGLQSVAGGSSIPDPSLYKRFVALLCVSPQQLDGELEMRKFFGSKVIVSSKASSRTASKRVNVAHRSTLTNPKPNWWPAQLREGLSIRQLTPDEREDKSFRYGWSDRSEELWWTVEYGKKYRAITMAFMQTVMSGGR